MGVYLYAIAKNRKTFFDYFEEERNDDSQFNFLFLEKLEIAGIVIHAQ
jgi:hypothetical protein